MASAPGACSRGQTDSNQENEYRSKMISDLTSAVKNAQEGLSEEGMLSQDLKGRKDPVTENLGIQGPGGRNCCGGCPEMGVKVPCPGAWWSRSRASSGGGEMSFPDHVGSLRSR